MQTKTITIEFDADEIETLGEALCLSIRDTIAELISKDLDVDDYVDEERTLLYDLTGAGYQLWMNADARCNLTHGKHTIDVDEWIDHEKARALAKVVK